MADYFSSSTEVNNFIFWLSVLILISSLYIFFMSFINNIISKVKSPKLVVDKIEKPKELPTIAEHSTTFFSNRLAQAFPGQRGLMWYEPTIAVKRLKILFQEPLQYKTSEKDGITTPIWWFRGSRDMFIDRFKILSKTKVLMDVYEMELKHIAVLITSYRKSFVYLEAKAEKQTGLYNLKQEDINGHIETFGYSWEEYGLWGKKLMSRAEFDDGATVINGRVVEVSNAELRVRYLSDYNFIIAAQQSPYDSNKFERESEEMFNDLLKGKIAVESFFEYLDTF